MRLTNLGAGEYADRLTILALKILHGARAKKDVSHFEQERALLLVEIRRRNSLGGWLEELTELGAVNASLWMLTDRLRAEQGVNTGSYHIAGLIGLEILAMNDRRAELVDAINRKTGEYLGPEKAHAEGG